MEISHIFNSVAKEKGIKIEFYVQGKIPVLIRTDLAKLNQILFNIVGNAIKFTERGRVTVTAKFDAPSKISFLVVDSGIGMASEKTSALFRPFEQVDSSYSRKFGGAGLGLALSRRLANALGGDVTLLSSVLGKGSIFVIEIDSGQLPETRFVSSLEAAPETPLREGKSEESVSLLGLKVLVVDDSADNQTLVSRYLNKMGAAVNLASNGAEGVAKALASSYDLVLMDMQMPVMDGCDAVRKLRSAGYKSPIVALTAHALPEEHERSKAAGCDGHLVKPITRRELGQAVRKYTSGRQDTKNP